MLPDPKRGDRARAKAGTLIEREIREERRDRERAEANRVRKLGARDAGLQHGADMGAGLAIERGQVEVNRDALVPDRPGEKDSPTRIGARGQRVWAPDRLLRKKLIAPHHHLAAEKYLDDFEIGHEGARDRPAVIIARAPGFRAGVPSEKRRIALGRFLRARQRVGREAAAVLAWCVLRACPADQPPTLEAFAEACGWRVDLATGMLLAALGGLAEFYGCRPPRGEVATIVPERTREEAYAVRRKPLSFP